MWLRCNIQHTRGILVLLSAVLMSGTWVLLLKKLSLPPPLCSGNISGRRWIGFCGKQGEKDDLALFATGWQI